MKTLDEWARDGHAAGFDVQAFGDARSWALVWVRQAGVFSMKIRVCLPALSEALAEFTREVERQRDTIRIEHHLNGGSESAAGADA